MKSFRLFNKFVTLVLVFAIYIPYANSGDFSSNVSPNGIWNNAANWTLDSGSDEDGIPDVNDNVTILAGDQINLNRNETCNNLTINSTGTLNNSTFSISVNGNYTVNGSHGGTGGINLDGIGFVFDGTGNVTNTGTVAIRAGNCSIAPTLNLWIFGHLRIQGAFTVTNNGQLSINKDLFTTFTGATFINASGSYLYVGQACMVTGTLNASASSNLVLYGGSGNQTIKATTYSALRVQGGGTKTLGGTTNIQSYLTIDGIVFATGGNSCTLLSNASGTGRISKILNGGSISGNITIQRYISNASNRGWRHLAMPLTNGTLSQWNDDVTLTGIAGTGNGWESYWASVYWYDEDHADPGIDDGWTALSDVTDAIANTQGYAVWLYDVDLPTTIDVTGTVKTGNASFSLTYDDTGTPANDGWNLVGNPYPSAIDWESAGVTYNGSVNDAIYIWSDEHEHYEGWVNGSGVNHGTQYIASTQGFFVQTNGSSPTLSMTEDSKSGTNPAFYAQSANSDLAFLKLKVSNGNRDDEAAIYFRKGATSTFDGKFDAWKLWSTAYGLPNISTVTPSNEDLSINGLPAIKKGLVVPVRVKNGISGYLDLTVSMDEIDDKYCVVLEDLVTGEFMDIPTLDTYNFYVSDVDTGIRFLIHFDKKPKLKATAENLLCHGDVNGTAFAIADSGLWNYKWFNTEGVLIHSTANVAIGDTLLGLTAGTYTVMAIESKAKSCESGLATVVIHAPPPLNIIQDLQFSSDAHCNKPDGTAAIQISGGVTPYNIQWNDDLEQTGTVAENLTSGTYTAVITDANGCTRQTDIAVANLKGPTVNHLFLQNVSCQGNSDGSIRIDDITGGMAPYEVTWSTGQSGNTASTLPAGIYEFQVTDANGCNYVAHAEVEEPALLKSVLETIHASCHNEADGQLAAQVSGGNSPYSYTWNDGQAQTTATAMDLPPGTYKVVITDSKGCQATAEGTIAADVTVIPSFSLEKDTIRLYYGETAAFHNQSTGATAYTWNFGDGTTGHDENPAHTYTGEGIYTVELTAMNGSCSDTYSKDVVVVMGTTTGLDPVTNTEGIRVSTQGNRVNVVLNLPDNDGMEVSLVNLLGQTLETRTSAANGSLVFKAPDAGVYLVQVKAGGETVQVRKVTVR